MPTFEAPLFPAGEYQAPAVLDLATKKQLVAKLADVPSRVSESVEELDDSQLDTNYRNWTVRQIVHHLADSHMNCYVRFKWALTESCPTIKSYDESSWSELPDAKQLPVESSLKILQGVHSRWARMIELLSDAQLESQFFHPESKSHVRLLDAIPQYVWHADHHLAQIDWLKRRHGW